MKNIDIFNLPKHTGVLDLEANNLHDEATVVWCASLIDYHTGEVAEYRPHEIEELLNILSNQDCLILHNGIDFDMPLLKKLHGFDYDGIVIDTFILSQMLQPQRPSHSLESYGEEVGIEKVQNEDWSKFTEHMLHRCVEDTKLTLAIFKKFQREAQPINQKGLPQIDWTDAINLEHYIATEVSGQSIRGCPIRKDKLIQYIQFLEQEVEDMYHGVEQLLGYRYKATETPVTRLFKKDGTLYVNVEKYWENASECVEGPYCKVEYEPVRLTMHSEVKNILLTLGWKPTQFTPKGSPKLPKGDEWDKIAEMSGNEGLKALATYGSLKNRLDILKGWKDSLRDDNTIRHGAFTCGTPTARFRHSGIVNVPRATWKDDMPVYYPDKQGSIFGTEMRELVHCPDDDYVQLGVDLSGIELRVLAHMINNHEFTDVVLNGDIHTFLWKPVEDLVLSRSDHKSVLYAMMYGAGNGKMGSLATALPPARRNATIGGKLKENVETTIPNFGKIIKSIKKASKRGWLRGLDGRKIFVGNEKDALNRYIQSTGAILFKKWIQITTEEAYKKRLDYRSILFMHDEIQAFVRKDHLDEAMSITIDSITKTGEFFSLNIPLEGEAKVGRSWSDCH